MGKERLTVTFVKGTNHIELSRGLCDALSISRGVAFIFAYGTGYKGEHRYAFMRVNNKFAASTQVGIVTHNRFRNSDSFESLCPSAQKILNEYNLPVDRDITLDVEERKNPEGVTDYVIMNRISG